jgi:hypothetical protein
MLASKIHVATIRQCPLLKMATEHRKIAAQVRILPSLRKASGVADAPVMSGIGLTAAIV